MGKVRAFSPHVRWTADEVSVLMQMYCTAPYEDIMLLLPTRTLRQVQNKAILLGLRRPKPPGRTPQEVREAKRLFMSRHRNENPEAVRAYSRQRYHSDRELFLARQKEHRERRFFHMRARRLRGEGRATAADLSRLWKSQRGRCAYTGQRLGRNAQLDHKQPRCKGGGDSIANLQWVTAQINYAKRDLDDKEFVALCESILRWIGERIAMVDAIPSGDAAWKEM